MNRNGGDRAAVHVAGLVKRYPKRELNAVDDLSFTVPYGEVFGLLGPNGAGKTTTVGVLTTRVRATSGSVRLAGVDVLRDPVAARARLAVVPQQSNLDRSLTPRQNLTFHAAYHGVGRAERGRRAARLLSEFGLGDQADVRVDWYSGGMAQRLMIARSLMHEPAVLFLDEPTTGLDPHARLFTWNRIRDLRERGITVVLTTHDMDEAAELADRVGIVDNGRLLALDTPASLIHGLRATSVLDLTVTPAPADDAASLLAALGQLAGIHRAERVGDPVPAADGGSGPLRLRLYLPGDPAVLLGPVVAALTARSAGLTDVHIGAPSLEDVFIELTGRGLR
jgi:ABC-2 type transport system ATP-binding protein